MISVDDLISLVFRGVLGIWVLVGLAAAHLLVVIRTPKRRRR